MDSYLLILKEKAQKINANIEICGNDKDCIKDILLAKVKSNLEHEDLTVLKDKATQINANTSSCSNDKNGLLNAIEEKVKETLEKENELHSSIDSQRNFKPLHFDQGVDIF